MAPKLETMSADHSPGPSVSPAMSTLLIDEKGRKGNKGTRPPLDLPLAAVVEGEEGEGKGKGEADERWTRNPSHKPRPSHARGRGRVYKMLYMCGLLVLGTYCSSTLLAWLLSAACWLSQSEVPDDTSLGNCTIAHSLRETLEMAPSLIQAAIGLMIPAMAGALPFARRAQLDYTTSESGNPFIDGWYADPDTELYDGKYWVFPTSSKSYEEQTYLDAFSSADLVHWEKHENILTTENVKWANKAVWAPAPISRNGKYYIYFGANDIQEGEPEEGLIGGIGVAVADKPEGPYVDAIGKPLIGEYHNGAQPIDQDVFIDDDGQAYIFYGGHSHCNMAKINDDMISIGQFDDGTSYKEITPEGYVEGPQMIKRNGKYYLMWSEGGWTGPDYSVSYAMADSINGPFTKLANILKQDSAVAKGSGHNGVIHIPGTDIWYIVYHRRPLSETDGNHRALAYDRMYFNEDGTIVPITMLVKDNFADGLSIGWKQYGAAGWTVADQKFTSAGADAVAMLDTNFEDLIYDATLSFPSDSDPSAEAGLLFRTTNVSDDLAQLNGYYAKVSASGSVVLEKYITGASYGVSQATAAVTVKAGTEHRIRVTAVGQEINVFVDDMETPKIAATDSSFTTGADGVRASAAGASFGSISVAKPQ